jgi:hypothetical protein
VFKTAGAGPVGEVEFMFVFTSGDMARVLRARGVEGQMLLYWMSSTSLVTVEEDLAISGHN